MTTHKDTAGIVERLEAASGPDRELDRAIFAALNPNRSEYCYEGGENCIHAVPCQMPHYSRSIDAALSLVPEGWQYQILHTGSLPYVSGKTHCVHIKPQDDCGWHDSPNWTGDANSAPLAICIAALKARMEKL